MQSPNKIYLRLDEYKIVYNRETWELGIYGKACVLFVIMPYAFHKLIENQPNWSHMALVMREHWRIHDLINVLREAVPTPSVFELSYSDHNWEKLSGREIDKAYNENPNRKERL